MVWGVQILVCIRTLNFNHYDPGVNLGRIRSIKSCWIHIDLVRSTLLVHTRVMLHYDNFNINSILVGHEKLLRRYRTPILWFELRLNLAWCSMQLLLWSKVTLKRTMTSNGLLCGHKLMSQRYIGSILFLEFQTWAETLIELRDWYQYRSDETTISYTSQRKSHKKNKFSHWVIAIISQLWAKKEWNQLFFTTMPMSWVLAMTSKSWEEEQR